MRHLAITTAAWVVGALTTLAVALSVLSPDPGAAKDDAPTESRIGSWSPEDVEQLVLTSVTGQTTTLERVADASTLSVRVSRDGVSWAGGPKALALWAQWGRLDAQETFSSVSERDLAEQGLREGESASMTVRLRDGSEHAFLVGREGYGHRNTYIRRASREGSQNEAPVHLVDSAALRAVIGPKRGSMVDGLFGAEPVFMTRAEVTMEGASVVLEHREREKTADQGDTWAVASADERAAMQSHAWMSAVLGLEPLRPGGPKRELGPDEGVRVIVTLTEGATQSVQIVKERVDGVERVFAKSAHTRHWVELYAGEGAFVLERVRPLFAQ